MIPDAIWIAVAGVIVVALLADLAFRVWFAARRFSRRQRRADNRRDEHAHWLGIGTAVSFHHKDRD